MSISCDLHNSREKAQEEAKSAVTKFTQTEGRVLFDNNKNIQNLMFEWFSSWAAKSFTNIGNMVNGRDEILNAVKRVKQWLSDAELMSFIKTLGTKPQDIETVKKILQDSYRYTTAQQYATWLSLTQRAKLQFKRLFNPSRKKEIDEMLLAHTKAIYFDEILIGEQNLRNKLLEIKRRISEVEKTSLTDEIPVADISKVQEKIDNLLKDENLLDHLFKNSKTIWFALKENQTMSVIRSLLDQKWVDVVQTKSFLWLDEKQLDAFKNLFWVNDAKWSTINETLKKAHSLTSTLQRFARASTFIWSFFSVTSQFIQTKMQLRDLNRLWFMWMNDELVDSLQKIWWLQEWIVFDGVASVTKEWNDIIKMFSDYNSYQSDVFKNWWGWERANTSAKKTIYAAVQWRSWNMGDFIDNYVNPMYQVSARNMAMKYNNMDARSLQDIIERMLKWDEVARQDYLKVSADQDTFLETITGFWNIRWMSIEKTWMKWFLNFFYWYQSSFGNSMLRNWLTNAANLATSAVRNWNKVWDNWLFIQKINNVWSFIWEVLSNPTLLYPVYQLLHSAKMATYLSKLEKDSEIENSSALWRALDFVQKMAIFYNAFAWIFSSPLWRTIFNWLRWVEVWEWYPALMRQIGQETFREAGVFTKLTNAFGKIKNADDDDSIFETAFEAVQSLFWASAVYTMRWYIMDDEEFASNFYKKNFIQNVIWLSNNVDSIKLKGDLSIARTNQDINWWLSNIIFDASVIWKLKRAWWLAFWDSIDPKIFNELDSKVLKNEILAWAVEWKEWRLNDMWTFARNKWEEWKFKDMVIKNMFSPDGKDILSKLTNIPAEKRFDDIWLLRAVYIDNYWGKANFEDFLDQLWNSYTIDEKKLWMLSAAYWKKLWEKYNIWTDEINYSYLWLIAMWEHILERATVAKWDLLIAPVDWKLLTNSGRVDYKIGDTIKRSDVFDTKKELKANAVLINNWDGTMSAFADTSKETEITAKQKDDMRFALGMKLFKYVPHANSNIASRFLVDYDRDILWKDWVELQKFQEWKIQQLIEIQTDLARGKWISNAQITNLMDVGRIRDKWITPTTAPQDKFERQQRVALAKLSVWEWISEMLPKLALEKEEITAIKVKMFMENRDVLITVVEDPVLYEKYKDVVKTALGNIYETSKEVNDIVDDYALDIQNWWESTWWGWKWKKWPKLSLDDIKPFKDFASKNFKLLQTAYNETKAPQRKATAPEWRGFFQWVVKSDPAYSVNPYWDMKTSTQTPIPTLKRASTRNKGGISRFSSIWKRTPKRKLSRTSSLTNSW